MVDAHFKKYPVLSIDFKVGLFVSVLKKGADQYQDVRGSTFEGLLASFDSMIASTVVELSNPFHGIVDSTFVDWCRRISTSQNLQVHRDRVLRMISVALQGLYNQAVVVLIDEYDAPMHSAIEHGYAHMVPPFFILLFSALLTSEQASEFFATVFGSLLKVCLGESLELR